MHPSEALSPRDVFGSRVFGYVMDLALIGASAGPLAGSTGWLFALVFSFVYLGIVQGITGWSLSKAMLGTKLVRAETTNAPGPVSSAIRWLLAPLGFPILTMVSSAFNDRRQGVGDLLARTEVIGLAPSPRARLLAAVAYIALIAIFIAASSFNTFLIVYAIFTPMLIAGVVVVLGGRRMEGGGLWLAGLGFAFVAAALLSAQGLCKKGEGICSDLSNAHKAIPALIILMIAIGILFTMRGLTMYVAVAALTAIAEIWMFLRLKSGEDMAFGAVLMLILLAAQLIGEGVKEMRRRKDVERLERLRDAAATGGGQPA
jgi:hypothetical protein